MSLGNVERELPEFLRWNPNWIVDQIPEWWLVRLDDVLLQKQIIAIRLETQVAVLQAHMDGLGKAIDALRGERQG